MHGTLNLDVWNDCVSNKYRQMHSSFLVATLLKLITPACFNPGGCQYLFDIVILVHGYEQDNNMWLDVANVGWIIITTTIIIF